MTAAEASWLRFWEVFATIGFVLVIIGVVVEGVEHFKKFSRQEYGRKLQIEKIGWLVLVAGLAMEFLGEHMAKRIADRENSRLTGEAAEARKSAGQAIERASLAELKLEQLRKENLQLEQEIAQTSSNVFRMAPLKQPIVSVSASAWFEVRGTNTMRWSGKTDKTVFGVGQLYCGRFWDGTNAIGIDLIADDFDKYFNDESSCYYLNFHMPAEGGVKNLHGAIVETANEWDALALNCLFLPRNSEILKGRVTVIINGFAVREFPIPPQKTTGHEITARIQDGKASGLDVRQGGTNGPPTKAK